VRVARFVLAGAAALVALPMLYIGVFLIGYSGDTGGDADVTVRLGEERVDADIVGAVVVAVGALFAGTSVIVARSAARAGAKLPRRTSERARRDPAGRNRG
jgi:hypothetical protein